MTYDLWVLLRTDIPALTPADGDEIGCFENNSVYSYDANSGETEDGDNVITPKGEKGAGRWIKEKTFALSSHSHINTHYTKTQIDAKLALKANAVHNHDEVYYTCTAVNALVANLANIADVPPESRFLPVRPSVVMLEVSTIGNEPEFAIGERGIWTDNDGHLIFWNGTTNKKIAFDE